jgi:glycosyltransferase involved in cell wall biosynthesis
MDIKQDKYNYVRRKKVLFVIENLNIGGAERVFINLLGKFNRRIFECKLVLINSGKGYSYEPAQDVEVINLQRDKRSALFPLMKIIAKERPDIVFSNLAPVNILCLISKLILRNHNTKYIIRETTVKSISIEQTKNSKLLIFMYKTLIKLFYNYADGIVSLSQGTKMDLVKNFGVQEDKIEVIYNPIDIDDIIEKSNELVTDVNISKDHVNLICVGSLVKSKGHEYLVKAVYKLNKNLGYKIRAYFIGTGRLENHLKNLVTQLELDDDIVFLGYKRNPFKYMKECDIFVLPAIWEGFGNVIVEAMVCNIPVVSTNCPSGPREIINHKINGVLAEPQNVDSLVEAIRMLIDDQQFYKEIQERGAERAKDFEANIITRQYERFILSNLEREVGYKCGFYRYFYT